MNRSASLQAANGGSQALLRRGHVSDVCPELEQNRLVTALGAGNVIPRRTIASRFAPMCVFRAGERAVDLHIFPSHASDIEAALETLSNSGAVEFRNAPNCRDGLGHVLDEKARYAVIDD